MACRKVKVAGQAPRSSRRIRKVPGARRGAACASCSQTLALSRPVADAVPVALHGEDARRPHRDDPHGQDRGQDRPGRHLARPPRPPASARPTKGAERIWVRQGVRLAGLSASMAQARGAPTTPTREQPPPGSPRRHGPGPPSPAGATPRGTRPPPRARPGGAAPRARAARAARGAGRGAGRCEGRAAPGEGRIRAPRPGTSRVGRAAAGTRPGPARPRPRARRGRAVRRRPGFPGIVSSSSGAAPRRAAVDSSARRVTRPMPPARIAIRRSDL